MEVTHHMNIFPTLPLLCRIYWFFTRVVFRDQVAASPFNKPSFKKILVILDSFDSFSYFQVFFLEKSVRKLFQVLQ